MDNLQDTIAAVSTAIGGGIAIIRLSGEECLDIAKIIFKPVGLCNFESHKVYYGHIILQNQIVDEVMLTVMKAPKSYTCEDVVEISCHGGVKAVEMVLNTVLLNGARLAEPGEFTKRAFLNGRIDLNQAQAVIELINAKTETSHNQALGRLKGGVSEEIQSLRDKVIAMIANIEASIDYPEHDMDFLNITQIGGGIEEVKVRITQLAETAQMGIILNEGVQTVILGKPNVGKSSLLNTILRVERAIVTDVPGTTRDILQEIVNIRGIPLKIVDTAGIRPTTDIVEKFGVDKSLQYAEDADLILFVLDGSSEITKDDLEILEKIKQKKIILVVNKTDLPRMADITTIAAVAGNLPLVDISVKGNTGVNNLYDAIHTMFLDGSVSIENTTLVSNTRDKKSLDDALICVQNAVDSINCGMTEDIIVIDLMQIYKLLGEITGESVGENVIDRIFSDFCLGK